MNNSKIIIPKLLLGLFLYIILFVLSDNYLFAQSKIVIQGKVVDLNNQPLQYANIFIRGTSNGSMTDENGFFTFTTKLSGKLLVVASLIGYSNSTKEVMPNKDTISVNFELGELAIQLKETIVSASSYSSEKEKGLIFNRIDVLTTPGGAADIFQAIKTLPGLTQVSESAELYVRGGDPTETTTIVNQAVLYHPFTFESNYGGIFSNLNQSAVRSIYFTSGGFSAKYGNALSGVLEIDTRNVPEKRRYQIGLSIANGSFSADVPIIYEKFGLYFDIRQNFTKPLFWLNGGLNRFTATPESKNATAGISYLYSKTGRIKLFTIYADDSQGVNVERAEYNGPFNGDSKNFFIDLQNSDFIAKNIFMKNSLSYNQYSNLWDLGILDLTQNDQIFIFRNDFDYTPNSKSQLLSGFEYENRKVNIDGVIPSKDYDFRPDAEGEKIDAVLKKERIGFYIEYQSASVGEIENLSFNGGLRYDFFPQLNLSWLDPRISLVYKLNDLSNARFGWGIFHQAPEARLFAQVDGNPSLKSMNAIHYIVSYEYLLGDQNSFRVELYHKKYENLPFKNPVVNYDNSGYGFANGVDVIFKGTLPFGINGWFSYGYINTKRKWLDYEELTSSTYDITHNLTIVAKYNLSTKFQIGVNAKFATGRPYTNIKSSVYNSDLKIYEPEYASTNSSRFPNYKRVDLRLTYFDQIYDQYPIVVYLEGLNIFDFPNIFGYTYSFDYSEKKEIKSYFGNRMFVLGFTISI